MSWGIEVTGTKAAARKKIAEYFAATLKSYEGKPEGEDIKAVAARADALIEVADVEGTGQGYNFIVVKAFGSHWTTSKGIGSASFSLSISGVRIELDP